ncbi:MAG: M61 family metallopeptidase [Myxococcota bacterium]
MRWIRVTALGIAFFAAGAGAEPIRLSVDLRDAPQRVLHARQTIPVTAPGLLALRYPKWIPGEHAPAGPIVDLAGLRVTAGKQSLRWERDPVEMELFRVTVPAGVSKLEIALDYLAPSRAGTFTSAPSTSANVAIVAWNTLLLYPDGARAASLQIEPELELPPGWEAATSLRIAEKRGHRVRYAPVSLETLIDSPVAAGLHYRAIPLAAPAGAPDHVLHLVADSEVALQPKPEAIAPLQHLVPEAEALFGAHHYGRYDFLLTLSDHVAHFGMEHHESSDNRLPERTLLEEPQLLSSAGLLPHEFVHSWNGKYRRPAGVATRDYSTPMVSDLLWVYEGLTSYLGDVLTARSGLVTPEQARDGFALQAAALAHTKGREWRPLGDTARDAQDLFASRWEGSSWRRSVDFYDEGVMIWLEVDALIRAKSRGAKSLDDFCRAFFGPPGSGPEVKPYTRAELAQALSAVVPNDWEAFFRARVDELRPGAPVEGLEAAGWRLVYTDEPNVIAEAYAADPEAVSDLRFSLGAVLTSEGRVADVVPGAPFDAARIGVGAELVAVNARAYTPTVLADGLRAARDGRAKLELLVKNADFFTTHSLDYRGGARHPHLVRDETHEDSLSKILAPRSWKPEEKRAEAPAAKQ